MQSSFWTSTQGTPLWHDAVAGKNVRAIPKQDSNRSALALTILSAFVRFLRLLWLVLVFPLQFRY